MRASDDRTEIKRRFGGEDKDLDEVPASPYKRRAGEVR